ncbi:MAG TPA: hypothetical protein VGB42_01760, partial [Candidatus Thermoplasmatota archaeon]
TYLFFANVIVKGQPAQVNVTIENLRNAPFPVDPKIILEGEGVYNPASRVENSTLTQTQNVPARGQLNYSMAFTPHRGWAQSIAIQLFTNTTPDSVTDDNPWIFNEFTLVLQGFDGAETTRPDVVSAGFSRVNSAADANTGSYYWFTGSGNSVNNTLTLPWIDTRYFNGTGPGQRSIFYIDDFLYLAFWYRGDVTAPDGLFIDCRNSTAMTWVEEYAITGSTRDASGALEWQQILQGWNVGGGIGLATFGLATPEYAGDLFIQCRLRYATGAGSSSIGYRVDDIGWYVMQENPAPPDLRPNPLSPIVGPSPSFEVRDASNALIAGGNLTGPITVNETETVVIHVGISHPQGDAFTYQWSSTPGALPFLTLPPASGFVHEADLTISIATDLDTYEAVVAAAGGGSQFSVSLAAVSEMSRTANVTWVINVRDARPTYSNPTTEFTIPEDGEVWYPVTGVNAWFTDPEGDVLTPSGTSPSQGGFPTVTFLTDNTNGTYGLRATSPDWFGLTNMTLTAMDTKGSSVVQRINVTITPVNDAPRFDPSQISTINTTVVGTQGQPLALQFAFWDVDDQVSALAITIAGNHASAWDNSTFPTGDPNRGILNLSIGPFAADNSVVGRNDFNITFCDAGGLCTTVQLHVTILNINDPPRIDPLAPVQYAQQGERFQLTITASDPDDLIPGQAPTTFYWSDDTTFFDVVGGLIDFVPTNAQVGTWQIIVRVNDSQLTASYTFQLVVNNTNDAPVLPATWPDIIVSQDQFYSGTDIVATDLDLSLWELNVPESLVYADDTPLFNVETVSSPKPTGEPQYLARISFKATNEQVGTWNVNITVSDAAGERSTMRLRVIVNNINDSPTGVRVNISSQIEGDTTTVTVPNSKVSFMQDDVLDIVVTADDPDMRFRVNEPAVRVDPAERLQCSVTSTFVGSLGIPQPDYVKPTVDTSCAGLFEPGNEEVGIFTVSITVRDNSDDSATFRFQLEIKNVNDPPKDVRIISPSEGIVLLDTGAVQLSGVAADPDSPDSALTYSWTVEVIGGQRYTANGKTAQITVDNPDPADHPVMVTLRVTDNLDITNPIVVEMTVNGTIKGRPAQPGFEAFGALGAIMVVAGVAALAAWQRRRRD